MQKNSAHTYRQVRVSRRIRNQKFKCTAFDESAVGSTDRCHSLNPVYCAPRKGAQGCSFRCNFKCWSSNENLMWMRTLTFQMQQQAKLGTRSNSNDCSSSNSENAGSWRYGVTASRASRAPRPQHPRHGQATLAHRRA
jgi:hypothetical protein